jgi:hypothetical protein
MAFRGRRFLLLTVGLLLMMVMSTAAVAADNGADDLIRQLMDVRQITQKYKDLNVALADGYHLEPVCVASPDGGMGYHAVNFGLFADPALNPLQPEALLYANFGGQLRLVGVEWLTPDIGQPHPSLFGQPFDGPMPGHAPGMPVHYDLHAWIWLPNPSGVFAQWNPLVTCP